MNNLAFISDTPGDGNDANSKDINIEVNHDFKNNPNSNKKRKSVAFEKKNEPEVKEWTEYTKPEKISYVLFAILKVILFIVLLYLFLLSLSFMTIGFTMVSGYAIRAGPVIKFILSNPFAALAIGIIATAIMQNAT